MSFVNQALIVDPGVKPKQGTASKLKYDNELAKEVKDDVFGWYADIVRDLEALLAEEVAAAGAHAMQLGTLASAEAAETSSAAAKRAVTGSKAVRRAAASDVLREAEAAAQSSDKVQRADAIVAGTLFSETTKALRDSGDVDACAPSMTQARVDFRVAFAANKSVDEAAPQRGAAGQNLSCLTALAAAEKHREHSTDAILEGTAPKSSLTARQCP